MSEVSEIQVQWTPNDSGRVSSIQIQSRFRGAFSDPEEGWTEQAAAYSPTAGTFTFTSNAPGADVEVRARYRMTSGVFGEYFYDDIVTAKITIPYIDLTGTPSKLEDINPNEGGKLSGIEDEATKGAPDGTEVAGRPAQTVIRDLDNALETLDRLSNGGYADTEAPPIPTGLALSSTLTDNGASLSLTWSASTASDFSQYIVAVREAGGNYIEFQTSAPNYQLVALPRFHEFTAKIAAADRAGNRSGFSIPVSLTTARDEVAPALPTDLSATPTYNGATIAWKNAVDTDLSVIEVWRASTSNSGAAIKIDAVNATPGQPGSYIASGLAQASTYYFFLKSVDTSNNASAFTPPIVATTTGGILAADLTPGLSAIQTVSSLPPASGYTGGNFVYFGGDLYRLADGVWTKKVDGADIVAGTIRAAQIAAGAITATRLAIGSSDSIIPDSAFQDAAFWMSGNPGGVTFIPTNASWPAAPINLLNVVGDGGPRDWYTPFFEAEAGATYRIRSYFFTDPNFQGWINPVIHMPGVQWFSLKSGAASNPDVVDGHTVTAASGGVSFKETIITNASIDEAKRWQFRFKSQFTGNFQFFCTIIRVSDSTLIADGAITTPKITVGSLNGDRITANTLDANTVRAGTVLSNLVQVANTGFGANFDIGAAMVAANNPAARINQGTTTIVPGFISISGGTTLDAWRDGTQIKGGAISASSISADKLKIGARGVSTEGIDFQTSIVSGSLELTWGPGAIRFTNGVGNNDVRGTAGGNTYGIQKTCYIYWIEGENALRVTNNASDVYTNTNAIMMATYDGGYRFNVTYGGTIIDGQRITTGSITADRMNVGSLSAITANIGTVTAGVIRSTDNKTNFDVAAGRITFNNGSFMKVSGNGFGSSDQFLEWYGPSKSTLDQCTEALAIQYLRTDGQAYFGGKVAEGQLRTTKSTYDNGNSQVANGPLVSNGKTRTWTAALSVSRTGTRVTTYAGPSGWSATFVIEQLVSGNWVQKGDVGSLVGYSYQDPNNGYADANEPSNFAQTATGSQVFVDNSGGTDPFQVRARITSISTPGPSGSSGNRADSYTQILSINTYEV